MYKKVINPDNVFNSLQYGFSQAAITKDGYRVQLSGQVGVDENEIIVSSDLEAQTEAAIDNIEKILKDIGGELKDVVFLRIYFVESERNNQQPITKTLLKRFPQDPPATSWIIVSGLSEPEWLIEIEAEAVTDEIKSK